MRIAWVLVAVVACGKGSSSGGAGEPGAPPPAAAAELDAMWKLAPDGAVFGVVASPRALQLIEHAAHDISTTAASAPELAPYVQTAVAKIKLATGSDAMTLASVGLSADKPTAIFGVAKDGAIWIVPLADRDVFLKTVHGTKGDPVDTFGAMNCKTIDARYVCATDAKLFDALGKGKLDAAGAGARGDIEVAGAFGKPEVSTAAVIQLARGAFVVRGTVNGVPAQVASALGTADKPKLTGDHAAGFGRFNAKTMFTQVLGDDLKLKDSPYAAAIAAMQDPIEMSVSATGFDARIDLTDPAPVQTALATGCSALAAVGATWADNVCRIKGPQTQGVEYDAWIDGKVGHIGQKDAKPGAAVEPTPIAKELADGAWQVALYGRGSYLGFGQDTSAVTSQLPPDALPMMKAALRGLLWINETAFALKVDGTKANFVFEVRTAWANSDAVVTALAHADIDKLLAGKAADIAKPILADAKGSLLEGDVAAGFYGALLPAAALGMVAAVAIPAFESYMRHGSRAHATVGDGTEASLQLNRIGKNLKVYYVTNAAIPAGDAVTAGGCCDKPDHKCAPDPAMGSDKIWSALDFQLAEPTAYSYHYHSDGNTATVTAIGDPSCSGTPATYSMAFTAVNGDPEIVITTPAAK